MPSPDSKVDLGIRNPITETTVYLKENKHVHVLMFINNAQTEVLKIRKTKPVTIYVYLS